MSKDNKKRIIPNEICIKIFQNLPRETIYQCIYVCNTWSSLAIQEYFKKLSLNDKNIALLQPLLEDSLSSTTEGAEESELPVTTLGNDSAFVKSLAISEHNDYMHGKSALIRDELFSLLYQMPDLKKLNFISNYLVNAYLERIDSFFQEEMEKKGAFLLKEIQQIAVSFNHDEFDPSAVPLRSHEIYYRLCYALHSRLTHLKLGCFGCLGSFGQSSTPSFKEDNYWNFLSQFENLTKVCILND